MSRTILITGATGRQGSGVISALLSSNHPYTILAATRDPTTPRAQALLALSPSLKLVRGDLDDLPTLWSTACAASSPSPIWGVYSVQVSMGPGVTEDSEVRQGTALIDTAVAAGVGMFVYSSVDRGGDAASWDTETPIGHFRSKYRIEHYLRDATRPGARGQNMGWTILRPVAFMDNLKPEFETSVFLAAMRNHVGKEKRIQWIASRDIGQYAAMAFADPEGWNGKAIGLAGDELTLDELREVFREATGKPAPVTYWFFGSVLTLLVKELRLMIGWFGSDGYKADVAGRRREYPKLLTLGDYLRQDKAWQGVAVRCEV